MGRFSQEVWDVAQRSDAGITPDFEDIFDRLEGISEASGMLSALRTGHEEEQNHKGNLAVCEKTAEQLQNLIRDAVIEEYGQRPRPGGGSTSHCWRKLLRLVHPGPKSVLPIFTTNYDLSFEYLRQELQQVSQIYIEDAFDRNQPWRPPWRHWRLTTPQLDDDKQYAWIFRLHGCVAWEKPGPDDKDGAPAYLYFGRSGQPATDLPSSDRALVWPSKRKRPFEDPFWTEYRYFLRCLDTAELLIVLGYGLQDQHIVRPIEETLHSNPRLNVLVLDADTDALGYWGLVQGVGPLALRRVAFVNLSFDLESMRRLEHMLHDRPLDIEAGLRAVAWCSADSREPAECVDFDDTWTPYVTGLRRDGGGTRPVVDSHKKRWTEGPESNWVLYEAQTASKEHGLLLKQMSPAGVLEGEITIEVSDAGLNSWGALALAWLPADRAYPYPRFYAVENQGGDVKLKKSLGCGATDHEELCDLGPLHVNEERINRRRIWFRISPSTVQVAAVTDDGRVMAAHSQKRDDTEWPLACIALAATNVTKHSIIFQDLKIIRRS